MQFSYAQYPGTAYGMIISASIACYTVMLVVRAATAPLGNALYNSCILRFLCSLGDPFRDAASGVVRDAGYNLLDDVIRR